MMRLALAFAALLAIAAPVRAAVDIEEVTSPGGITAWLVREPSIPFTALEIRFRGGASLDLPGKRGAINLMTGLLEEGAGDLDARAFAEAREALAASFDFDVRDDELSISARFLTENRDAAVELLRSALAEPRFDEDAVERVRAQVLSIIRTDVTDPGKIAMRRFDRLAFGDHPYASALEGTEDSVSALVRADLFEAKLRAMTLDKVYIGAVGDIAPDVLGSIIDRLLGDLPRSGPADVPDAELKIAGGVTAVPFATPQSVAVFGHRGISQDDPDFFAAYLLSHILGGSGFDTRLMTEVRERRGLTYGISSFLVNFDHADLVLGQVASANARMAETIDVVKAEWARISESGVTEEELENAKTYLTGSYPLRFDGNARIANILVGMQLNGFPIDYIATRNDRVNAVSLEDANRVANRLYRPDQLRFVVVGQPEGLGGQPAN